MNVLMISIGDDILQKPVGDVIERHVEYAKIAGGEIHMITYSPYKNKIKPQHFDSKFFIYPSGSKRKIIYPFDAYKIAKKLIQDNRFDIIYTQDPFGTAFAGSLLRKRFKTPLIIGNHSNFIDNELWISEKPLLFNILNILAKYLLHNADAWRVLNDSERQEYLRLGIPADKIWVLNTPCYPERFAAQVSARALGELRDRLGIPGRSPVLLWVGRPVKFKRIPVLFEAFKEVLDSFPDAYLVMIGDKKVQQEDLQGELKKCNIRERVIWITEGVSHTELPGYYQLGTVYAHTSHFEGFGKVMVEASASGLPVVATDSAGARRIVKDGETGYIVPIDDVAAFADRVSKLFADSQLAHRFGQNGRSHVLEAFGHHNTINDIVKMWHQVAKRGRMVTA